jgi:NADH-quinone oxidoreductase subunit C
MTPTERLSSLAAAFPGARRRATPSGVRFEVASLDADVLVAVAAATGLRFGTITGTPSLGSNETDLVYHFVGPEGFVDVATATRNGAIASLAPRLRPASWAEREIHDLFAVDFVGHPDPSPLMRPEGFEVGMMRAPMCAARRPTALTRSE